MFRLIFASLVTHLRSTAPTVHIIGTLTYLNGTSPECCPTRVIPGSFRSCRRPKPGETSFEGRGPLTAIAAPGDTCVANNLLRFIKLRIIGGEEERTGLILSSLRTVCFLGLVF